MKNIFLLSTIVVLLVLGANHFWPEITKVGANPSGGLGIDKARQAVLDLPKNVREGVDARFKEIQRNLARKMMEKTGGGVVDILETLPQDQQEEIKKQYCAP